MQRGSKYWILLTLTCLIVGSTVWVLTPAGRAHVGAGAANTRQAAPQARVTLHTSALAAQSRFGDAADLQESSAATARVAGEMAVDLRQAGTLDLVTLRNTDSGGEIEVRLGTSNGDRGLPTTFRVGGEVTGFEFGHFSASGNVDIIVGGADGTLSVLNGDGQGGFTPGATLKVGGHISSLAAGDITRSGLDDLLVVDQENNDVKEVLVRGDLGSATVQSLAVNGLGRLSQVRMADFDNDYHLDMVVAGDQGVAVMYGDGTGSFGNRRNLGNPGPATGIAVADFSGDAFPDIAVSTQSGVAVWTNKLAKGFSRGTQYAAGRGVTGVTAGTFNDDEFPDLAVINGSTSQVSILLNAGGKGFLPPMAMDVDGGPSALVAGRFSHSGINSIAIGKADGRTVMAVPQVVNTVTVTTTADENDCPSCDVAGLLAFTNAASPNAFPGGTTGISLREAITAINNDNIQHGSTGWTISFAGISRHEHDNMEAASAATTCGAGPDTYWLLSITSNLPAILSPGLTIDGTLFNNDTSTMGDGVANTLGPSVFLSGAGAKLVITSSAPSCTIKGLGITHTSGDAIQTFSPNCNITNNVIGLACDSVTAGGANANSGAGIQLMSGSRSVAISGNIISNNGVDGIIVNGVSQSVATPQNNTISGNKIGITRTNGAAGNTNDGILLQTGATGNSISGNTISGNAAFGIEVNGNITSNAIIQSNFIGTDPNGTTAIPNTNAGIGVDSAGGTSKFNQISSNVISGNTGTGIRMLADSSGNQFNTIILNKVGVNVTGSVQVPNGANGIVLDGQASGNTIGGATYSTMHNEISGNTLVGLLIKGSANNNVIQNNDIGPNNLGIAGGPPADLAHSRQVSNKGGGVQIDQTAASNVLSQNNIAFNEGTSNSGIVHSSTGNFNKFTQNLIFLNPPDVAPGSAVIQDTMGQQGMRNSQIQTPPMPIKSLIKVDTATTISQSGQTTITGTANFIDNSVTANVNNATIELFASQRGDQNDETKSEGQAFIGSVSSFQLDQANPNTVDWVANVVVPSAVIGQTQTVFITATITTGDGSTSPFSIGHIAQASGTGTCTFNVNPGSLNFNNAPIGQTTNQTVTLSVPNTSTSVTVTAVVLTQPGSLFARSNLTLPTTLQAGQSLNVTIGFTPTDTSQQTATLRISDTCMADTIVQITGQGAQAAAPKIGVVPPSLNFGNVNVTKSASLQFFVSNFGNAPLNVATLTLQAGASSQFSIPSNPAPFTVAPQSTSAGITVNFNPTSTGSKTDTLVIASNDPTTANFNLPLTGTGVQTAPPVVTVQTPGFQQVVIPGQPFNVNFNVQDAVSVVNYQLLLSTNNGVTFGPVFGSGSATVGVNIVSATILTGTPGTTSAVLQVKVLDSAANTGTGNSAPFTIAAAPILIQAQIVGRKFVSVQAGSNIVAPAVLVDFASNETWELDDDGAGNWVVFKFTIGSNGRKFKKFLNQNSGGSITVFARNPNGLTSASVVLSNF